MISFDLSMTLRWACREGDFVFWAKFQGIFSSPGHEYRIADIWELKNGDFITITNRYSDLPDWFDLHPTEVSRPSVSRRKEQICLEELIEAPNIWRVFAGDRVVWVGLSRPGIMSENGVLELVDFRENALIYGEPLDFSGEFPTFGGFERKISIEGGRLLRAGWDALNRLGIPRIAAVDDQWSI